MEKIALFVFNGDPMCFVHVLLNVLDFADRGTRAGIVVEGGATALIGELAREDHDLHLLWQRAREKGLVFGVCRACARKTGSLEAARAAGLPLLDDMNGHPSMGGFRERGYRILTF